MSTGDSRLVIQGQIVSIDDVKISQKTSESSPHSFRHANGVGAVDGGTGAWACGQIRLLVKASGDADPSIKSLQAVTTAFADVAGCWSGDS